MVNFVICKESAFAEIYYHALRTKLYESTILFVEKFDLKSINKYP